MRKTYVFRKNNAELVAPEPDGQNSADNNLQEKKNSIERQSDPIQAKVTEIEADPNESWEDVFSVKRPRECPNFIGAFNPWHRGHSRFFTTMQAGIM